MKTSRMALLVLVVLAPPAPAQVLGKAWRFCKRVVPVLDPGASAVEKLLREGAKQSGVNPDIAGPVGNPGATIINNAPEIIKGAILPDLNQLRAEMQGLAALFSGDMDALQTHAAGWLAAQVDRTQNPGLAKALQPLMSPIVPPWLRESFMEQPSFVDVCPPQCHGDWVYYVNGINTDRTDAEDDARALAVQLSRPVRLIHNPPHSVVFTVAQVVYDRLWLAKFPASFVQFNAVTKQVTHLLYHSDGPISIVTHSQGCLIMRNALLTAHSVHGGNVAHRVRWVATGVPLRDEEVPPCDRFTPLANPDDPVAQSLGLRVDSDEFFKQNLAAHSFTRRYVSQIQPAYLWPSDTVIDRDGPSLLQLELGRAAASKDVVTQKCYAPSLPAGVSKKHRTLPVIPETNPVPK